MELFNFAHFLRFEDSMRFLAERLALPEPWTYSNCQKEINEGNNAAQFPMPILRNYLEHTFRKINSENKIGYTHDVNLNVFQE